MNWMLILNSVVYAAMGGIIFCLGFVIVDRLTPYNLWEQIVKEKNVAVAILVGSVSIGLCIIIAAAIH